MTNLTLTPPRNPQQRHCVLCTGTFADQWAYHGHLDACIAARRAAR